MTIEGAEAFPLHWPNGWERTRPSRPRFDTNFVFQKLQEAKSFIENGES